MHLIADPHLARVTSDSAFFLHELNSEEQRQLLYSQEILEVIELVLWICGTGLTQRSIQDVDSGPRICFLGRDSQKA